MHRRSFLKATALAPAAMAIGGLPADAMECTAPFAQLADNLDASLFSTDGLAFPIANEPTPRRTRRGWTVRSFSAAAAPTTSRGTAAFPWPLRAGHRRARSRRHDRWNLGRLVCRILAGDRPLPAHASRVRLLRALSGALCPRGAGERGRPQPGSERRRSTPPPRTARSPRGRSSVTRRSPPTIASTVPRPSGSLHCSRATARRTGRPRRCTPPR